MFLRSSNTPFPPLLINNELARTPAGPPSSLLLLVRGDRVLAVLLRAVGHLRLEPEADAEVRHELLGLLGLPREVVREQAPPLRDEGKEAAPGRVVLRVR